MQTFRYKHGDRPLEGFTIQRAVGRGGFGEVYYALSDSGREVALKVIQGYEQIELRGVGQCMNLKSPHLVTIFDVRHNDDGAPFVIMEYVAGPSLRELIDDAPAGLGPQKAAFFLREIAKGLTYLHDRGIVHRDLKPGNIFYEDCYVKIGDYGLSKAMSASQHSGQTVTVGTVHYMAPEIGRGRYDKSIDVYALGILLYEMLTGQTPFLGASPGEILMKHLMAEPDLEHVEEPFRTVIRKAMSKEPGERYTSAQEMVEAVFGTEHIRNSVSHFRAEDLSLAAARVGERVAVGGPGSSAEHAGQLGGSPAQGGMGSSDGSPEFGRQMGEFGERMGRWGAEFGERMGRWSEEFSDRMAEVGQRLGGRLGSPSPGDAGWPAGEQGLPPTTDPLDWNQRRFLAIVAAGVFAVGSALLGGAGHAPAMPIALTLFVVIAAAGGGLISARLKVLPKLRYESGWTQQLVFVLFAAAFTACFLVPVVMASQLRLGKGDQATLAVWIFIGVCVGLGTRYYHRHKKGGMQWGRLIYLGPLALGMVVLILMAAAGDGWLPAATDEDMACSVLCVLPALLIIKWRSHTSPQRKERLSLGDALSAGLIAGLAALIFDGWTIVAAGTAAGIVLVTQTLAPWDPLAAKNRKRTSANDWKHDSTILEPSAACPAPAPQASAGGTAQAGRHAMAAAHHAPAAGYAAPGYPFAGYAVPAWARAIFTLLFIAAAGTAIMLLIWIGMANFHDPVEWGIGLAFGLGLLPMAVFFLVRAVGSTYRGLWSYLVRPVIMLLCCQSALVAAIWLGAEPRLDEYDMLGGLAFIIFPAIICLVVAFIPQRTVAGITASAVAPAMQALAAMRPSTETGSIPNASPRLRLYALLLSCVGFLPIPLPLAGLHRFYVGKIGTGILWLLTGGLLGIGTIIDIILIASGGFTDANGKPLLAWTDLNELRGPNAGRARYSTAAAMQPAQVAPGGQQPMNPVSNPTPVNALDRDVPPGSTDLVEHAAGRSGLSSSPPPRQPRNTNVVLTLLGGFLLTIGLLIGLIAAMDLSALVAAGWPDPSLADELTDSFGYTGWPLLLRRVGMLGSLGFIGLGILLAALGRRRAGFAHAMRALLAGAALMLGVGIFADFFAVVRWPMVADMLQHDRIGPAMEYLLDQLGRNTEDGIFSAGLLLGGILVLAWPERRPAALESVSERGGMS